MLIAGLVLASLVLVFVGWWLCVVYSSLSLGIDSVYHEYTVYKI